MGNDLNPSVFGPSRLRSTRYKTRLNDLPTGFINFDDCAGAQSFSIRAYRPSAESLYSSDRLNPRPTFISALFSCYAKFLFSIGI